MSTDFRAMAKEFADKQAAICPMTAEQYVNLINETEVKLAGLDIVADPAEDTAFEFVVNPKNAIKDASITCVICGEKQKILTREHLKKHGHTKDSYLELCGYKKGTALCAKALRTERRKKMQEMKLWERKGSSAQVNKEKSATKTETPAAPKAEVKKATPAPAATPTPTKD